MTGSQQKADKFAEYIGMALAHEPDSFDGKTASELTAPDHEKYYTKIEPFTELREFLKTAV